MIKIEQGESSPYIEVDSDKGHLIIRGDSFVSNPQQLYAAVVHWGNNYLVPEGSTLNVEITIGYYSTSNIQLLNILFKSLNRNNPDKVSLTFYLNSEEEEDLEETMVSLVYNTSLKYKRIYLE